MDCEQRLANKFVMTIQSYEEASVKHKLSKYRHPDIDVLWYRCVKAQFRFSLHFNTFDQRQTYETERLSLQENYKV